MLSTMIAREKITANDSELQFIIALAGQCFLNEYVYSMTEQENITVNTIINSCRNGDINETNIAILACYIPLYKLLDRIPSLKSIYASKDNFKELIKLQVSDPLNEFELSRKIKKIGLINDNISQKVKSQYEKNPYPRWKYADPSKEVKISYIETINAEISPNSINSNLESHQLKILIAGCGTGNQILQAQRYNNAEITGIDLSSSSLAYAQRKVNQLGINNVELFQMDILEVKLLEKYYDIIECGGVLHHMADPKKGLNALLSVLQKEGFLKLGLYSELARTDIVKAREYIATNNLLPNDEGIKAFREDVFSNKVQKIKDLKNLGDFYTTSECRDLCFHAQEHRFTINQLEETLYSNDLQFLGFLLPQPIKSLYKNYFPEDQTQTNLQNWARFEEKNPYTFIAMYQFWVSKKNIYHFKE